MILINSEGNYEGLYVQNLAGVLAFDLEGEGHPVGDDKLVLGVTRPGAGQRHLQGHLEARTSGNIELAGKERMMSYFGKMCAFR